MRRCHALFGLTVAALLCLVASDGLAEDLTAEIDAALAKDPQLSAEQRRVHAEPVNDSRSVERSRTYGALAPL